MIKEKSGLKFFLLPVFSFFLSLFSILGLSSFLPERDFVYKDFIINLIPSLFFKLASFDGVHYILISSDGYKEFEQAFFPLYPLLIRIFSKLFSLNPFWSGVFISWLSFFLGYYFMYKFLLSYFQDKSFVYKTFLFWFFFPTAFYFFCVYTESLFFFLLSLSLYFLYQKRIFPLFFSLYFLALTRFFGVFFVVVIFFSKLNLKEKFLASFFNSLGLLSYMLYLYKTTGNPLMFFSSQQVFGARESSIILWPQVVYRYLKIFFTSDFSFLYFVAVVEFLSFVFPLLLLLIYGFKKGYFSLSLKQILNPDLEKGLFYFSLICFLIPPLTGVLTSLPRYLLLVPSFFIALASLRMQPFFEKFFLFVFVLFFLLLAAFFGAGYFVS